MESLPTALDTLRTVEFRETLRGYHRDDVDEYLEKAAQEAEALQEQVRQMTDRLRQAGDRVADLENRLQQQGSARPAAAPAANDETLQRTLMLAQKFVDQTKTESEAEAARIIAEAEAQARALASDADRLLREEVVRLERSRAQLTIEVDEMGRHLEGERLRLKAALTGILQWVDENVQQSPPLTPRRSDRPTGEDEGADRGADWTNGDDVLPAPSRPTGAPTVASVGNDVDFFTSPGTTSSSDREPDGRVGGSGSAYPTAEAREVTPVRSNNPIDTATRMHA